MWDCRNLTIIDPFEQMPLQVKYPFILFVLLPQESKFDLALKVYKRAFGIVEGSHIHREEDKEACKGTVAVLRLNMALCHLKLENGLEAREECEKVLEVDNDNIKALFRKGQVSHVHLTTMPLWVLNIS